MKDLKSPQFEAKVTPLKRSRFELPDANLTIEAEKPVFIRRSENPEKGTQGIFAEFKKAGKKLWIDARDLLANVSNNPELLKQVFDIEKNTYIGNCKIGYNKGNILVLAE